MDNNARCPKCNGEFVADYGNQNIVCPHCGETVDAVRSRKYFTVFHAKALVTKEAHGNELFKFEEYLRAGAHHLEKQEFDEAREAYTAATEKNPADYRGFMGLVAVETRNYTDLKNTSHKQYLQRALSVANEEQQQQIAAIYRGYDIKTSMTDAEYDEYLTEKQKDYKARVKKAIVGFSKVNDGSRKKAKTAFVLMFVLFGIGLILFVLGLVLSVPWLVIPGALFSFGACATVTVWSRQKYNDNLYSFLVELFNALKGFDFTREQTEKTLDFMASILISVKEGDPTTVTDGIIHKLTGYIIETGSKSAAVFLKTQNITAKYIA